MYGNSWEFLTKTLQRLNEIVAESYDRLSSMYVL